MVPRAGVALERSHCARITVLTTRGLLFAFLVKINRSPEWIRGRPSFRLACRNVHGSVTAPSAGHRGAPPRHPSPRAGPLSSTHTLCLPSSSHEPAEGPTRDAFQRSQSTRDVPGNAARRRDSEKPDRALETGSHESSFSVTGQQQTLSRGHFREHARPPPPPSIRPRPRPSSGPCGCPWQRRGLIRRGCT